MKLASRLNNSVAWYAMLSVTAGAAHAAAPETVPAPRPAPALEEVVVTAQKRVENAQKTPLAVTSLGTRQLAEAHVVGIADLSRVVPDLKITLGGAAGDAAGAEAVVSIRGLGASATGPQGSSGVAQNFDGIYRQTGISDSEFFDLERVEVDPGPQGTLYGRSAAAGALNVLPNKPVHRFEGEAGIEFGNYGEIRSNAMLNVPVDDTLALRFAMQTQNHDGYLSNGYDDEDAKAGRIQALWTPTADLSIRLYGDYINLGGRGASDVYVAGATLPLIASVAPPLDASNPRDRSIAQYCLIAGQITTDVCKQRIDYDRFSVHADVNYNLGWGQLEFIPGYINQHIKTTYDQSPLPLAYYDQNPFDDRETTVELRLSNPAGQPFKWVGGFDYYHNTTQTDIFQNISPIAGLLPVFGPGGVPVGLAPGALNILGVDDAASEQNSYAVFGQATYPVLHWLRLTAGGRYNFDDASYHGSLATLQQTLYYFNGPAFPPFPGSPNITTPISTGPLQTHASFRDATFKVGLDADISPTSLAYVSVGTGYKPGGLNDGGTIGSNPPGTFGLLGAQQAPPISAAQVASFAPNNVFQPEKVTHYEIGSKNRFLNNRLQVNDAFYYDSYSNYQNGQTQVVNPLIYRVQGFIVTNAGHAEVYGNELSVNYALTGNDLFGVTFNYLHARFTRFSAPGYLTPAGAAPGQDLAGQPLANAPTFSGTLSYQHILVLPRGDELSAGVYSSLSQGYQTDYAQSPGTYQKSWIRTAINLTYTTPNRLWTAEGFVSNVENSLVKTFGLSSAGYSQVHYDPPRTFGFSLSRRF